MNPEIPTVSVSTARSGTPSSAQQSQPQAEQPDAGTSVAAPVPHVGTSSANDFLSRFNLPQFGNSGGTEPESYIRRLFAERPIARADFLRVGTEPATDRADFRHREMVVNWLMRVREVLHLRWSTLAVAVVLGDRVLKSGCTHVRSIRLLGLTCLWLAAKHEELQYVPQMWQLIEACGGEFTEGSFRAMELEVLSELNFKLCTCTPFSVIGYLCEASAPGDNAVRDTAHFVAKVAMIDTEMASERPIIIALAIVHLALVIIPDIEGQSRAGAPSNLSAQENVRDLLPELVNEVGKDHIVHVAKKLLDFWCFLVDSHDEGNRIVLVRRYPKIAGRVFTQESAACLLNVYGCSSTNTGAFARWAAEQSLLELLYQ